MFEVLKVTLLGLFFGTFGTTIGGIIGITIKKSSNKFLSFILSFASGLMFAIVTFSLLPEAMEISSIFNVLIGIIMGILCMTVCDYFVDKIFTKRGYTSSLLKTGVIVSIGLAIHNFPEGLAIGSGFEASLKLGYALAIAICIHDIPEGLSMAVPMKNGGMNSKKVIWYVVLSGITTGIGAFFGKIIGEISEEIIAICLSFAAGAMLYIVAGELLPKANKIYDGKISTIGNIAGFILGLVAVNI